MMSELILSLKETLKILASYTVVICLLFLGLAKIIIHKE